MSWQKKKQNKSTRQGQSIIQSLRQQQKSSEEFELMVSRLTLEELISLKLELSANVFTNKKFFGFPIWQTLPDIVKEGTLQFALNSTSSQEEAARFLGISCDKLRLNVKKFLK